MTYEVNTVDEYLDVIPEDRRGPLSQLRAVILENLPEGFEETISYKFPSYVVPLSVYPDGYHCKPDTPLPFISIASQKQFIAFYHMGIYSDPDLLDWFQAAYADLDIGKLDMGKSCIRLRNPKKIPFDLLRELVTKISVEQWIATYEKSLKR